MYFLLAVQRQLFTAEHHGGYLDFDWVELASGWKTKDGSQAVLDVRPQMTHGSRGVCPGSLELQKVKVQNVGSK